MASDRPTHWIVDVPGGLLVRVEAMRATVCSGVLLFTGRDEDRIGGSVDAPVTLRLGELLEAFAPGQWLHVRLDESERSDLSRRSPVTRAKAEGGMEE